MDYHEKYNFIHFSIIISILVFHFLLTTMLPTFSVTCYIRIYIYIFQKKIVNIPDVKWGKTHSYINKKNPTQVTEKSHRLLQQKEKWPRQALAESRLLMHIWFKWFIWFSSEKLTVARDWISVVTSSNGATNRVWVDTVSDLNQYKPSQDELEARKLARKSNNKLLAKVLVPI